MLRINSGRDLLIMQKHEISHFVRNDILAKELLGELIRQLK